MTGSSVEDLREERLKYLGAVTASLSHEINNVLAIVGELAGLIDDLVEGAGGGPLDPARLKTIGEKISRHVERGKGQVSTLNRFAHSVDDSWSTFDSGVSVAAVVAVCDRFARLGKVELQLEETEGWPRLEGSLSDFEHLVFRAVGAALLTVDRGAGRAPGRGCRQARGRRSQPQLGVHASEDTGGAVARKESLMEGCAVLVVDDEEDYLETLVERLRHRELDTTPAADGEEALEKLAGGARVDVVVLDVGLPGLGGLEVLERIKQLYPTIQVLMLSGHADVKLAVRGMDLGAFDYMVKPVQIEELVYRIEDAYQTKLLAEGDRGEA
jgi:CheY-like chemotaxis protein